MAQGDQQNETPRSPNSRQRALAVIITAAVPVALALLAGSARAEGQQDGVQAVQKHQHVSAAATTDLFPAREASGTAWLPDETPMYGLHRRAGEWQVMLHGAAFGQLLYEGGERHRTGGFAATQGSSVNWFMAMGRRHAGAGRVGVRAMASLEPWTVRDCGFINLLANGEMCEGDTIHDRQHPHDLVMELAVDYERPIRGSLKTQIYAGLAGEPALGPAGFPHRISALANPVAPIAHHWLDSSHITYGLVTAGLHDRRWKAEMSVFNGREPDENRADLDLGPLDSVSGRLTFMPTPRLSVQVSAAHLHGAEADFPPQPRSDVERATASLTYHRMGAPSVWATTLAYGLNSGQETAPGAVVRLVTHAVLLETNLSLGERHGCFGRFEVVGKAGHDLHVHEAPTQVFAVGKVQGGYVRYFNQWNGLVSGIGGTASVSIVPPGLASRYSGRVAPAFGVFLVVRPSRHVM